MQKARVMYIAILLILLMAFPAAVAKDKKVHKSAPEATIYGTVSCSIPLPPPDPAKAGAQISDSIQFCLSRRGKIVIVDEVTRNGIPIENPDVVQGYEGHRVSTSGYMNGESFHIVSLRKI